ncbi:hypothetical protein HJC23_009382 [Cyclotella cryptica]|uniref:Uncharacterized protein n=1 Tax=Cyclotella cryptica TaxID=29204 RepID=A0ABD3PWX8_9STRA|eukprot:CCRYP_010551-RA/>CCRYP_010551-RA protein AED:0.39 eAED:0.39 QI:255/1/1/1/1/1/3/222/226
MAVMRTSYYKYHVHDSNSTYWTKAWRAKCGVNKNPSIPAGDELKVFPKVAAQATAANDGRKHVHFSDVTVREYEIIPSDTPAVSSGAGIELGWKYNIAAEKASIDDYENVRCPKRRQYYECTPALTALQRRIRLSQFGYSKEDIDEASSRAAMLRKSNERSIARRKFDRVSELTEDIGRSLRRLKSKAGIHRDQESPPCSDVANEVHSSKQLCAHQTPNANMGNSH